MQHLLLEAIGQRLGLMAFTKTSSLGGRSRLGGVGMIPTDGVTNVSISYPPARVNTLIRGDRWQSVVTAAGSLCSVGKRRYRTVAQCGPSPGARFPSGSHAPAGMNSDR